MMDSPNVYEACSAIYEWQKRLIDHKYADINTKKPETQEQRFEDQKRLADAALKSAHHYLDVMFEQVGSKLNNRVLNSLPLLDMRIKPHELDKSNYHTDSAIHTSLGNAGVRRGVASEYTWWHLLTLRQIRDGKLDNPPAYLMSSNYSNSYPFNTSILNQSRTEANETERKNLDTTIRNLIRHSGGIYIRKGSWLIDAPLAKAWWLMEIVGAASQVEHTEYTIYEIYEALRTCWTKWAEKAARSSTKVASPHAVLAYTIEANINYLMKNEKLPKGQQSTDIVERLIRRTQHLYVNKISQHDLVKLIH